MADKVQTGAAFTISAADRYIIGNAAQGVGGMTAVQLVSSSFVGTVVVQGRLRGTAATWVPISYKRRNLGGTVSDDTVVSADITAAALILIDSAGLDIALNCSAFTSGSLAAYVDHMQG